MFNWVSFTERYTEEVSSFEEPEVLSGRVEVSPG
jgi:hypothetical protein